MGRKVAKDKYEEANSNKYDFFILKKCFNQDLAKKMKAQPR